MARTKMTTLVVSNIGKKVGLLALLNSSGYCDPKRVRDDGEYAFYRVTRIGDHATLLAKVWRRSGTHTPHFLEQEFDLRARLAPGWAVMPLGFASSQEHEILILDDQEGTFLDQKTRNKPQLMTSLRLGISIANAISQLHASGLIHMDIKPSNVLVRPDDTVRLMGFGLATEVLSKEQEARPPDLIAGTLVYMAPEQTGRMNRSVDRRADLYSLGVILYELLSGSLPFHASDPMEWIHCHIARHPVPLSTLAMDVPEAVVAVVHKLLSKTPEERYQTAAGVAHDLQVCLTQWQDRRKISMFPLGASDTPDQLLIPQKLYGREQEIQVLRSAFERVVAGGRPELVLVSGYSGIGKSSVVNELHPWLVPLRGNFASGKFDQYKRDIPYATIAHALRALVIPLLSKGEQDIAQWRAAFHDAIGPNGPLITDLVPELRHITGDQPPVPELPAQDAQRRLHLVIGRFLKLFGDEGRPLTLFLDDLQWLDAATLDLLADLLLEPEQCHLLLVGAYRDNEVDRDHPLWRRMQKLRDNSAIVSEIVLRPLPLFVLQRFVADAVHCDIDRAAQLAEIIHQKTGGNPFFASQFLAELAYERLLTFDAVARAWRWDVRQIAKKGYTDNVIELMVRRLRRLPEACLLALQRLACLGIDCRFELLQRVYQDDGIHERLRDAVRSGLIIRTANSYKFLHDRVQEAAYSLIAERDRPMLHLKIGLLLAEQIPAQTLHETVFDVVSQLNRGLACINSDDDKRKVARLNFLAGERAKQSTAYASAIVYLRTCLALLSETACNDDYQLLFDAECTLGECELLTAQMRAAELRFSKLANAAANSHDAARVARLRLMLFTATDRSDRSVEICLEYMRSTGTIWSASPTTDEVRIEYDRIWQNLGRRNVEDLLDLPFARRQDVLDILDVLAEAVTPALFCNENLSSLIICRMVNLSLEHGNSDGSCFAYVWFAIIAGPRFGNYTATSKFGRLGYNLVELKGLKRYRARTYMSYGDIVLPWERHVRSGRDLVRRAFDAANQIGDLTFAAYSCNHLITNLLAAGDPLADAEREALKGLEFAKRTGFGLVIDHLHVQLALIRSLRQTSANFGRLYIGNYDEPAFEAHLDANSALAELECWYYIRKLQIRYFAGDYQSAVAASRRARRQLWTSPSQFETAEYHFYSALSLAAICNTSATDECDHLADLKDHHAQLKIWSEHCPDNFENRFALVDAEVARISGRDTEAMQSYEKAIRSANKNGFHHNTAIAYEVAATFYDAGGFDKIAQAYYREARDHYKRWGAIAKANQLDPYASAVSSGEFRSASRIFTTPMVELDFASAIRVSNAIAHERDADKLVHMLMSALIEHAGADRGLLVIVSEAGNRTAAEAYVDGANITVKITRSTPANALAESVLQYVLRTKKSVILQDALHQPEYRDDPYIMRAEVRSLHCKPLLKQGRLVGALYLENKLATHSFTAQRIATLELLASQATQLLENISLSENLAEREVKQQKLVDASLDAVIAMDENERIVDWNSKAEEIFGWRGGEVVGRQLSDVIIPPQYQEAHREGVNRFIEARREARLYRPTETTGIRRNGEIFPIEVSVAAYKVGGGWRFSCFIRDITDRKRSDAALLQTRSELARISRMTTLGELVASISHEIRQPISAVITDAKASLRWMKLKNIHDSELSDALERIANTGKLAAEVITSLRALTQKTEPRFCEVDLDDLIKEVLVLARGEFDRWAIDLETRLGSNARRICGDKVQLQQVLLNLVTNAIDAMSGTINRPRLLTISSACVGAEIIVSIKDTGPGINAEIAEKLFESFFTTKDGGMGLGLSICRSIITNHGGRIWVVSRDAGDGAEFKIAIPSQVSGTRTETDVSLA